MPHLTPPSCRTKDGVDLVQQVLNLRVKRPVADSTGRIDHGVADRRTAVGGRAQPIGIGEAASRIGHDRDAGGTGSAGPGNHHNQLGLPVEIGIDQRLTQHLQPSGPDEEHHGLPARGRDTVGDRWRWHGQLTKVEQPRSLVGRVRVVERPSRGPGDSQQRTEADGHHQPDHGQASPRRGRHAGTRTRPSDGGVAWGRPGGGEEDHITARPRQLMLATALLGGGAVLVALAPRTSRLSGQITWAPPAGSSGTAALAYRVAGSGLPATVLLHGLFASGRYWGANYDALAGEATLLVPDLAGFGRSLGVADGFGPEAHADLVARTVAEVGLAGEPVLIGAHSLGCLVAVELARRHPGLVAGIVAFSPPLYANEATARRYLSRAHPLIRLFVARPSLSEAVCDWMCEHHRLARWLGRLLRPELPRPLAEDRFKHTYRSYSQTLAKVILAAGAASWIEDVAVPIHLVAGTDDDLLDRLLLVQLAESYPHVSLSLWTHAEHELPLTHPARCVAEIQQLRASLLMQAG